MQSRNRRTVDTLRLDINIPILVRASSTEKCVFSYTGRQEARLQAVQHFGKVVCEWRYHGIVFRHELCNKDPKLFGRLVECSFSLMLLGTTHDMARIVLDRSRERVAAPYPHAQSVALIRFGESAILDVWWILLQLQST